MACSRVFAPWSTAITADTALSLDGRGRLDYHLSQAEKREYLLRRALRGPAPEPFGVNSLEVKFRTRAENGILLHVQGTSNYTTVKVRGVPTPRCSASSQPRPGLPTFLHPQRGPLAVG